MRKQVKENKKKRKTASSEEKPYKVIEMDKIGSIADF